MQLKFGIVYVLDTALKLETILKLIVTFGFGFLPTLLQGVKKPH